MNGRLLLIMALIATVAFVVAACGGAVSSPTSAPLPSQTPAPAATTAPAPAATAAAVPTVAPTPRPADTPTPAGPRPKYGGTLAAAWFSDYRNWDTWDTLGGFTTAFTKSIMSNLIQFKPGTFEIAGDLATGWQISPDGKTITFTLRKDAKWHNGTPVTSDDIIYNFRRGSDPRYTFNAARVRPIASMEMPDQSTFKVTLKDVSNSFLPNVASAFMLMYPSSAPSMPEWHKAPMGSGPFAVKEDKPNDRYVFVKNSSYYARDAAGGQLPYLDGITWYVIADPALTLSAFRAHRITCGCTYDQNWANLNIDTLRREITGLGEGGVVAAARAFLFNLNRAPFNNALFRQGVAIGFDKATVAATHEGGKLNYSPAPPLLPPEIGGQWGLSKADLVKVPGWNESRSADVQLAQQKLRESGIDPRSVEVRVLGSQFYAPLIDLVASILKSDLGLKVTTVTPTSAELAAQQRAGNFDIRLFTDGQSIDDPSDQFLDVFLSTGAKNDVHITDARLDELLLRQDKELDQAVRRGTIAEAQRIVLTQAYEVPMFYSKNMRVWWPELKNYRYGPLHIQNFDFSQVWLEQ